MFPVYIKKCPDGVYEKAVKVTDCNTDAGRIMQPGDLAREMEKITEEHLKIWNLGQEKFVKEKKLWVIAWTSYWIKQLPAGGDTMVLRVWPGKRKNVMYQRKYAFYTREGHPLVCASSLFVLMDRETRKLTAPIAGLDAIPEIALKGEPGPPPLQMDFPDYMGRKISRIVQAEEIDSNGHLNNSCYLDWSMCLAGELLLDSREPGVVWVKYNKELVLGQKVTLYYEYQKDRLYIHGISEGTSSFMLILDYRHQ